MKNTYHINISDEANDFGMQGILLYHHLHFKNF